MGSELTSIVLVVEYDGSRYYGSQLQKNKQTIQGEMERAVKKLLGEEIRLKAASRTDAGVHAEGQVFSFEAGTNYEPKVFVNGLNHFLPQDIAVKSAYKVSGKVDVRRSAVNRKYCYRIFNNRIRSPLKRQYTYNHKGHLDIGNMNEACKLMLGTKDFTSFASAMGPKIKTATRDMQEAYVTKDGDEVVITMVANAFLPHQVRNTVGALLQVGQGRMTIDEFNSIILEKKPGLAGPAVPAVGLCLKEIRYLKPFGMEQE